MEHFHSRLGVQQRVLPAYRAAFFDVLAERCPAGVSVLAGKPLAVENIFPAEELRWAQLSSARNWHFLDPASPYYLCWQSGFLGWLEAWQPEALIVEANPRYPATRLAVRWMHQRGRKVLGWGLGAPPLGGKLAKLRSWERVSFLRTLDGVIAYSRRGAEEYLHLGLDDRKLFVARNAVDRRPVCLPPARSKSPGEPACVLFVGRLQARKRVDLLLQACAALPVGLQPRLVIVGDGPERQVLEGLAQAIYPRTEFPGAKHGPELDPYFDQADLFVLPGTGGLAVQQAMAHGLPVIVSHGDGTQDDLVRAENGWQVVPDSLHALEAAIRAALSSPERLRAMGKEAFRIVDEEINLEAMAESFIHALNAVTSA